MAAVAELVSRPAAVGEMTTVTAAAEPALSWPRLAVTWPAALVTGAAPCEETAETKTAFTGNALVNRTMTALYGPALVTVKVLVT